MRTACQRASAQLHSAGATVRGCGAAWAQNAGFHYGVAWCGQHRARGTYVRNRCSQCAGLRRDLLIYTRLYGVRLYGRDLNG
eukprot:1333905-Prymnesium_polylepis.4